MNDVFISYSRKDQDFVQNLQKSLIAQNLETWVDWRNIPPTADWWQEICAGIEGANTFVFVVTPDSAASPICNLELDHAIRHNKRIVPVVRLNVDEKMALASLAAESLDENTKARLSNRDLVGIARDNWQVLSRHNWLFFREDADFNSSFQYLITTINTNLDYVREHTHLLVRAREWETKKRNPSFLLSGSAIAEAEAWLAQSPGQEPVPTPLHGQYISASRRAANRRQRVLVAGLSVALIVISLAALVAFYQSDVARGETNRRATQQKIAEANELSARQAQATAERRAEEEQSLLLANDARDALLKGNPDTALALALEAASIADPPPNAWVNLYSIAYATRLRRMVGGYEGGIFSPDGNLIIGADSSEITATDSGDGKVVWKQSGPGTDVYDMAVSPGSQAVAIAVGKNIILVNLSDGSETGRLTDENGVGSIVFSPDGRTIISESAGNQLVFWDVQRQEATKRAALANVTEPKYTSYVFNPALSLDPDGKRLLVSSTSGVRLWDVATASEIRAFPQYNNGIFGPDGKTILSRVDEHEAQPSLNDAVTLVLWNIDTEAEVQRFPEDKLALSAAFSPDGQEIVSGLSSGSMHVWKVATGSKTDLLPDHTGGVMRVGFSPDGRSILSLGGWPEYVLRLWDANPGPAVRTFSGHDAYVTDVIFSPDGKTALSSGSDNTIRLWDINTGAEIKRFDYIAPIRSLAFTPDGSRFLVASGGYGSVPGLSLWDVASGKTIYESFGYIPRVFSVACSPDGKLALTGSEDGSIVLWDIATGKQIRRFQGSTGAVWTVAFSPDRKTAASGGEDGMIHLWDIQTAREIKHFPEPVGKQTGKTIYSLAFNPAGDTLLSGAGWAAFGGSDPYNSISLWDISQGKEIRSFESELGRIGRVFSITYDPYGNLALSGSADGIVRLWDTATGLEIGRFEGHTREVTAVAFSPDGRLALSGSSDGKIRLWRIDRSLSELITWVYDNRYVRSLTCAERITYNVGPLCETSTATAPTSPEAAAVVPTLTEGVTNTPPASPGVTAVLQAVMETAIPSPTIMITIPPLLPTPTDTEVGAGTANLNPTTIALPTVTARSVPTSMPSGTSLPQDVLDALTISMDRSIGMRPGETHAFSLGTMECCVFFQPVQVSVRWSVEPAEGAHINAYTGVLTVLADTPGGRKYTVNANVEDGRRIVTIDVYVFTAQSNPLVGTWREAAELTCTAEDIATPQVPIEEVIFAADGTFSVTWAPFEVYKDYWGTYTFDVQKGTLTLAVDSGNYVPNNLVASGSFAIDDQGQLSLKGIFLGDAKGHAAVKNCGYLFAR